MEIAQTITSEFETLLRENGHESSINLTPDTVLLQSGLDSLGFAILIARLEAKLDFDPFVIMSEPVYPTTLGEFIGIYEKNQPGR
jgi:aryl carrier-like protein